MLRIFRRLLPGGRGSRGFSQTDGFSAGTQGSVGVWQRGRILGFEWDLIERHYDDLMRVVLSVAAGKISSVTLLRRLSTYSRRNNFYKAFREVGRVIRTIQLLRYLSDPQLRRRTTAATNKV